MINKKIASEIGIAVILLVAIVMGGSVWLQSKESVLNQVVNTESENKVINQQEEKDTATISKINTHQGHQKSLEAISNVGELELTNILYEMSDDESLEKYRNKITYTFASPQRSVTAIYDPESDSSIISEDKVVSKDRITTEVIPQTMIDFGVEGAFKAFSQNDEYVKIKNSDTALVEKGSIGAIYDEKYGWEWRFSAANYPKLIAFAVKPGDSKVIIVRKKGFDDRF